MESERRVPPRDGLLAPRDGLRVNLDPIIAATQITDQAEREVANPRSDIEQAVLRSKAATGELRPCRFAHASERLPTPRPVVVNTQVRRRQQRAAPPAGEPIDKRSDAMDRVPRAAGE